MNSLYSDLFGHVSGLKAESQKILLVADTIAAMNRLSLGKTSVAGVRIATDVSEDKENAKLQLAEQMADMEAANRAHEANARVLRVTDALLASLNALPN